MRLFHTRAQKYATILGKTRAAADLVLRSDVCYDFCKLKLQLLVHVTDQDFSLPGTCSTGYTLVVHLCEKYAWFFLRVPWVFCECFTKLKQMRFDVLVTCAAVPPSPSPSPFLSSLLPLPVCNRVLCSVTHLSFVAQWHQFCYESVSSAASSCTRTHTHVCRQLACANICNFITHSSTHK